MITVNQPVDDKIVKRYRDLKKKNDRITWSLVIEKGIDVCEKLGAKNVINRVKMGRKPGK